MSNKTVEAAAAPVGKNVSYALVIEKMVNGKKQVVTFVADAPLVVPRIGESFETNGTPPTLYGTVSQIHHNLTHTVGGKVASANCTAWVTLK